MPLFVLCDALVYALWCLADCCLLSVRCAFDLHLHSPEIEGEGVGAVEVAEKVEVLTRKAGEKQAWLWTSDGKSSYSIAEAERNDPGTSVTVYLKVVE